MKIALIGYGKMGMAIEELAIQNGHEVVLKLKKRPTRMELHDSKTQVAIEFTNPESAYKNVSVLLENSIPTVCGTTGWTRNLNRIYEKVDMYNGSFLYASNFSLGVNLFFEIVQKTARLMKDHMEYSASITETHHTEKKDAPSGTAITLAEKMILDSNYKNWALDGENDKLSIPIFAKREENVPGTHEILYTSEMDEIELKHTAKSRKGFALGALKAAEFIHNKNGIFTMKDVLGI